MERHLKSKLENGTFSDVTPTRSNIMAAIKGKSNKSTESALRLSLVRAAIRGWTLHPKWLKGVPDFYFHKQRLAVFVDGCFWHGCPTCGHTPKTRSLFWAAKFERNIKRDAKVTRLLRSEGLHVIRIWEHSLRTTDDRARVIKRIRRLLNK